MDATNRDRLAQVERSIALLVKEQGKTAFELTKLHSEQLELRDAIERDEWHAKDKLAREQQPPPALPSLQEIIDSLTRPGSSVEERAAADVLAWVRGCTPTMPVAALCDLAKIVRLP